MSARDDDDKPRSGALAVSETLGPLRAAADKAEEARRFDQKVDELLNEAIADLLGKRTRC